MAKKNRSKPVTLTAPISDFIKRFEKLRYNHNAFTVYSDFLAVSAISISNAVNFNDDREQEYLRIINKYNAEERALFPQMLACIVREMQPAKNETPRYYDVLGELFHNLNLQDEWKGQFFTPQIVSDFMALCTIGEHESQIEKRGYITLSEPCIGGGSTVIGVINAMLQKGHNPCKQLLVTGYDLDLRCVHMSYIQLSLIGVPAMIQQRNSLTDQNFGDYWFTPVFVIDGWINKLRIERISEAMLTLKTAEKPVQLTLF